MGNKVNVDDYDVIFLCEQMDKNRSSLPDFTADDFQFVRKVWEQAISDVDNDVGVEIFKNVFNQSFEIRNLFGVDAKGVASMESNGRLISHSLIMKNALNIYVQNFNSITDCSSLIANLRVMGAKHVHMRKEQFAAEYWYIFAKCIIDIAEKWRTPIFKKRRFMKLWTRIVCFVIVNMRFGYEQELNKLRRVQLMSNGNQLKIECDGLSSCD